MSTPLSEQSSPVIDFWFDFGSNYSYLSVMRIEAQAVGLSTSRVAALAGGDAGG